MKMTSCNLWMYGYNETYKLTRDVKGAGWRSETLKN